MPVKTVNTVLKEYGIDQVDIVSIDVEGFELQCLQGFDFSKYKPKVMVIENVDNNSDIANYLKYHNYELDKQYSYNQYYTYKSS